MGESVLKSPVIAVVVPCYRETKKVLGVLARMGDEISHIIVVDDCCPDKTGDFVRANATDPRVEVIIQQKNTGVGGATLSGYRRALELDAEIVVKVDGDGQMDPELIPRLIAPIVKGRADYTKGNRFHRLQGISRMPKLRIIGNLGLSFLTKFSSGYWQVFDPTNGFTAIHRAALKRLRLEDIEQTYFFESDILYHLNRVGAVVSDIPMRAKYEDETSSLSVQKVLFEFSGKHLRNVARRILYSYFLRDFNIASIELVTGVLMLIFGLLFGGYHWGVSISTGVPATAGTVLLAALPLMIATQLLLSFLHFDTRAVQGEPLQSQELQNEDLEVN